MPGPDSTFHLPTILSLLLEHPAATRANPARTRNATLRTLGIGITKAGGSVVVRSSVPPTKPDRGGTHLYRPGRANTSPEPAQPSSSRTGSRSSRMYIGRPAPFGNVIAGSIPIA